MQCFRALRIRLALKSPTKNEDIQLAAERERPSPPITPSMLNDAVQFSCIYYVMSVKHVFLALFLDGRFYPRQIAAPAR